MDTIQQRATWSQFQNLRHGQNIQQPSTWTQFNNQQHGPSSIAFKMDTVQQPAARTQ